MRKEKKQNISRRRFFGWGLGTAGTLTASSAFARVCGLSTGGQPLGPFFPRPGTPVDPIKENPDGSIPIFLSNDNDLTFIQGKDGEAKGQKVQIYGVLQDRDCRPIPDATIIIWQASESGRYNHIGDAQNQSFKDPRDGKLIERTLDPYFQSWGKAVTNSKGEFEFQTIVPGFYPADLSSQWYRPPHIHFLVSATGHEQFVTQMYFRGDKIKDNDFIQELNEKDLLLQGPNLSEDQRQSLVVDFIEDSTQGNVLVGQFDLQLT